MIFSIFQSHQESKHLNTLIYSRNDVGNDTAQTYNSIITNCTFTLGSNAIQIKNCRKLKISGNVFNGCDKAVYIKKGPTDVHTNAMIEVVEANYFNDVVQCGKSARSLCCSSFL